MKYFSFMYEPPPGVRDKKKREDEDVVVDEKTGRERGEARGRSCEARPLFLCFLGAGGLTSLFLFPSLLLRGVTEGLDLLSARARGEARRERLNTLPQEEEVVSM